MKFPLLATGLCFILTTTAFAQITGTLKDEKGTALPYANVAVLQLPDSTGITGAMTNEAGTFLIPAPAPGNYILRISSIGYTQHYTAAFRMGDSSFKKDVGVVVLKEDARALREVTVKTTRPALTVASDKMVVSVAGTAMAAGSTAFEVLEKAPGVFVDQDGNIQLNGKTGANVMVDGRLTYFSGKELQSYLEAMSAENIKEIEVISNPSAKYEAAGSSGIINIKLKQNTRLGLNGSLNAGYQYNGASGYTAGMNLNYKAGNWNSFLNLDMAERPRLREGVMIREFHANGADARYYQLRDETLTMRTPALRFGTDYDLNARHSLGTVVNLSMNTMDRAFYSGTDMNDRKTGKHTFVEAGNFNDTRSTNHAFNLHYNGQLDTVGTTLALSMDYIQLDNKASARYENHYQNITDNTATDELLRTYNPGYYHIYSVNADYSMKAWQKATLEAGIKASYVVSDNELNFYNVTAEQEEPDEHRSNHYRYTESILAGYVNLNTSLSDTWNLQAGLRGEQTVGSGKPEAANTIRKRYLSFFPSLFLTQQVSKQYQVTYSYSRRIDRPNYRSLNPFIFYQDPYSWAEGNPDLRPQFTSVFQVNQLLHNTYSLQLGYAFTKDFFAEVPEQNSEDNTTVYKERNIDKAENFSATLIAPVRLRSGWDVSNNLVAGYQKNRIILKEAEIRNSQLYWMLQSTHHVLLPWGLQLQATAGYNSPSNHGVYRFKRQWWLDAGLKRSFMQDKLDVTLGATDIFRTRDMRGDASYNGDVFRFVNYFMVRSIKLNLRYNFQHGQDFKARNRSIKLDELNRAGGQ
jgi:hypothetical protein